MLVYRQHVRLVKLDLCPFYRPLISRQPWDYPGVDVLKKPSRGHQMWVQFGVMAMIIVIPRLFLTGSLILALSAGFSGAAWCQASGASGAPAPIGKVLKVSGSVTLEHKVAVPVLANLPAGGAGQAKVDDAVYEGDVIKTGANSTANLAFADGTSFNISQNAQMELNEFVYSPKGKSNSTVFALTKGAFTFIAGEVAHTGSMKVETPLATMGIRGTAPHVEIREDGSVKFLTLIEENKKKPVPGRQDAQIPPAVSPARPDSSHKLCRNC
ncbi:MAG: FecR family protein [Pseudolabrys sp.]